MKQFNNTHRKAFSTIGIVSILVGVVLAIFSLSGIAHLQSFLALMPIIAGVACLLIASQIKA